MLINLLRHAKFIASAACVISIIIDAPAVSCTPKQIDLQAFFVTIHSCLIVTGLLLTSRYKSAAAYSILTKQIKTN